MVKKIVKYAFILVLLVIVGMKSVYFEKLDAHKASSQEFDAVEYAKNYWDAKLIPSLNKAIDLDSLVSLLKSDKEATFDNYSNALGIGNIRFFLVQGEATVESIQENDVRIVSSATQLKATIATEYIFGNAVRDASGGMNINEFKNTMDFNNVSAELNKRIRTTVIPAFRQAVKSGDRINFFGAIELNREHLNLDKIEVIPIALKIIQ